MDHLICTVVKGGYTLLTITIEGIEIPKQKYKWRNERGSLHAKAMSSLVYALNSDEFNWVCNLKQ